MFDRILETDQNSDIILKVIHKEPTFSSIYAKIPNSRSENNSILEIVAPRHQLQRKRQKKIHDYSQKSINYLNLVIVNPSPKLTNQEKKSVINSFDSFSQYQCIETNTKIVMTHVFMRWNEGNSN